MMATMTTNCSMKIINFVLQTEKIRYKFPLDVSADTIDKAIRREFNLLNDVNYSLVDTADNAIIDISTVKYLNDESEILIRIKSIENRSQ